MLTLNDDLSSQIEEHRDQLPGQMKIVKNDEESLMVHQLPYPYFMI